MAENTNKVENTEQIRRLVNNVHLSGRLGELEVNEGVTEKGLDYISVKGTIVCGEDPVFTRRFSAWASEKKKDGSDNKNYPKIREWAKNAVPMTKDIEHPTWVDAQGSVATMDYVNAQGTLVQGLQYNISFFNDFKEYACTLDIEGYIAGILDETKGDDEEPTGRKILHLISKNAIGNDIIDFNRYNKIIIPQDLVGDFEEYGYEVGRTATFFISLLPAHKEEVKKGGIGKQRVVGGQNYLEMIVTGADPMVPEDSNQALSTALIKNAKEQRKAKLKELENEGYQGGKSGNSKGSSSSSSSGSSSSKTGIGVRGKLSTVEDDEIPF